MTDQRFVTEGEFNLACKRYEDEAERQNARLKQLENNYAIVTQLSIHMERLATNMETMAKELARQGDQLNEIEARPAKHWDLVVTSIITTVAGAMIGMILKGLIV